jgi:glycyl-tRNA synthetase alpha subunit
LDISKIDDGNIIIDNNFSNNVAKQLSWFSYSSNKVPPVRIDLRGLNFNIQSLEYLNKLLYTDADITSVGKGVYIDFTESELSWNNFDKAVYTNVKQMLNDIKNNSLQMTENELLTKYTKSIKTLENKLNFIRRISRIRVLQDLSRKDINLQTLEARGSGYAILFRAMSRTEYTTEEMQSLIGYAEIRPLLDKLHPILDNLCELLRSHNNMCRFNEGVSRLYRVNKKTVSITYTSEFNSAAKKIAEQLKYYEIFKLDYIKKDKHEYAAKIIREKRS